MISKIKTIKNVGKFEDFNGTEIFDKNTAIFGFNGAGKSTLSDIFYSLTDEGKTDYVIRRRTLNRPDEDGTKDIGIVIEDDKGVQYVFENDKWNSIPESVYVFNNQYIDNHVFVSKQLQGNTVPIGMGAIGTKCMKQREQLINENKNLIEQINIDISFLAESGIKIKDFSSQKVTMKTRLRRFENMTNFFLYPLSDKQIIEEKIKNNTKYNKELKNVDECERKYENLKGLKPIDKSLLLKTVRRIPRISSKNIARFLNETLSVADIKWAVAGYKNQKKHEICPMCGQVISDRRAVELFKKLGEYIDQHKDENVREFCSELNLLGSRLQLMDLSDKIKEFNEIVFSLQKDNLLLKKDTVRLQKGLSWDNDKNGLLKNVIDKIFKKAENPYVEIVFTEEEIQSLSLVNGVIKNIIILGEIISQVRERLEKKIDEKLAMDDMQVLFDLSFGPNRSAAERIKTKSGFYVKNQKSIEELNGRIDDCYNQIQLDVINSYLEKLNTHIKLEVNKNKYYIQLKDFVAREYEEDDNTIFSEGEERAIAFAYFLAEVNDLQNGDDERIIIIDDPISSLDLSRKSMISYQIAEMMKSLQWQIIIMTHDIGFIERIEGFLARGVECKKLELRSEKKDFLKLDIKDYLTDDVHVYEELIRDAEHCDDELTRIVALMALRPYAYVKKVSDSNYDIIQKKSTYFAHTVYSKKRGIEYRTEDYEKETLIKYIDFVADAVGEKIDGDSIIGEYSFDGFDFNKISDLYMTIPLDSMKNARKKVLLMRPLIEACFFQFTEKQKFNPENIGRMYADTIKANRKDEHKHRMCIMLKEIYDSSKKYHHGADDGSLLGISWINPNEVEYYDQKLSEIISDIQANYTIKILSA